VSVALDEVARAAASLPRPGVRLAGSVSASQESQRLIASAGRLLDLAGRRDPFSILLRRARARLALVALELEGEPLSPRSREAVRVDAAAAVLLDPGDGASCAALARACWASGDAARARTWARRARSARRGPLPDGDEALAAALLSPPSSSKDGAEVEERAWLELLSGNREEAGRLVAEAVSLDAEARGTGPGLLPGTSRLVPASPETSEAFFRARLAAPPRGTPWAELWAHAALSRETFVDQGFLLVREGLPPLDTAPTGDAVNDLWRAFGFVLEVEAASPVAAGKAAAQSRKLLESVLERRPEAASARLLLDYVTIIASSEAGEVAEAATDLARLERVLTARHASPAILEGARALAEARLLPGSAPRRVRDVSPDARKLLDRKNLVATWTRWNLERSR
jgi:hypothetical protein